MAGKLRFYPALKIELSESEGYPGIPEIPIKLFGKTQPCFEVYDVLLKREPLIELRSPNTEVRYIAPKQDILHIFDVVLTERAIKSVQTPVTDLLQSSVPGKSYEGKVFDITDIELLPVKIKYLYSSFDTSLAEDTQKSQVKVESALSFDLKLGPKDVSKWGVNLDTEITISSVESGIEALASSGGQAQLPIFEEFINCSGRFPRSFSESLNLPFVVLIGEEECEWHIPIIYALKELFCEITDRYPRLTFREPELFEEGAEESVDSLYPHSLDQFTLEHKIEFLDARKMHFAVNEFVRMVKGRLKSGFLQQFGILVIAVEPRNLDKAKNALKFEGLRVYTCQPDDAKYGAFCSRILGVGHLGGFFAGLSKYRRYLDYTHRRFSVFVRRGVDASDRFQYPLKVATFVYLLNDLRNRKRRSIGSFEELCEFVSEVLESEIEVETSIPKGIIPDLTYSPEGGEEVYIEVETLIGTLEPMKKVDETVEKYGSSDLDATIWVILRPVSAVIHCEELKAREKAYRILYGNEKKVSFKVLTLLVSGDRFRWDIVDINDFLKSKNVR